jgi:hypothetical protein
LRQKEACGPKDPRSPFVLSCWLVVKLGTPQDRRLDRSDERQKGDYERKKGEGEMSTLTPSFLTPH